MLAGKNILQRVFQLRCDTKRGTCFTIDVDGRQYIVTAWHIAKSIQESDTVQIMHEESWKDLKVQLVGHGGSDQNDISVLATHIPLSPSRLEIVLGTEEHFFFSQEICFLGYPYGFTTEIGKANNYFSLPWAKGGIISSWDSENIYLDGHNNPGFSGGPVVCRNNDESVVIGVVSGYRSINKSTYFFDEKNSKEETNLKYEYNTGIVVARKIGLVIDMIKANPIGCVLP